MRLETGTFAWLAAGLLCMLGLGCCACVPLCLDSLKVNLYCTVLYCTVMYGLHVRTLSTTAQTATPCWGDTRRNSRILTLYYYKMIPNKSSIKILYL